MAEVNEEILEQYLKVVKGWFCIGDIPFAMPHNYSNIDVLEEVARPQSLTIANLRQDSSKTSRLCYVSDLDLVGAHPA